MVVNLVQRAPVPHANRGMAFQTAIDDTVRLYHLRGLGKITRHSAEARTIRGKDQEIRTIRTKGPVDYSGGYLGIPFAMDAKSCQKPRLRLKDVPQHQFDELLDWEQAPGSAGFLLVCFEQRWVFAITPTWYSRTLGKRESIRLDECADGVARGEKGIVAVQYGTAWVPVDFGPAVQALKGRNR